VLFHSYLLLNWLSRWFLPEAYILSFILKLFSFSYTNTLITHPNISPTLQLSSANTHTKPYTDDWSPLARSLTSKRGIFLFVCIQSKQVLVEDAKMWPITVSMIELFHVCGRINWRIFLSPIAWYFSSFFYRFCIEFCNWTWRGKTRLYFKKIPFSASRVDDVLHFLMYRNCGSCKNNNIVYTKIWNCNLYKTINDYISIVITVGWSLGFSVHLKIGFSIYTGLLSANSKNCIEQ
jgi:hypothetical protein